MKFKPTSPRTLVALVAVALLGAQAGSATAASVEERRLDELRNTVINLLQGLVQRGVLTREQAEQMVRDAQEQAAADAAAMEAEEQGAVRVEHVPEVVKEEIRRQVIADLDTEVSRQVIETARAEGWGVPAALPEWIRQMRWYGDLRVRGQGDLFASGNSTSAYYDYQQANERGGIGAAGLGAALNTTEDRQRLRARLRFGFAAELGAGWGAAARLSTGNLIDPVSTNQTLGNYGARYQTAVDLAYLEWLGTTAGSGHSLGVRAGRMISPWEATDLVFDTDLNFEGVATSYHLALGRGDPSVNNLFATVGAFSLQEFELGRDKWLLGAQTGLNLQSAAGHRFLLAAAVYDYRRIAGERNAFESELNDHTAPGYLQKGNTLFDIRNDNDPDTNLFALASDFRLLDFNASMQWRLAPGLRLQWAGNYVRNIGFDPQRVQERMLVAVAGRNKGYQTELGIGSVDMARSNAWRVWAGYRYLQRDAVLDGFTDSDFHLGGTDAKGYTVGLEWSLSPKVLTRLKYMSANEIDGPAGLGSSLPPPLGIDVVQLDFTATF